ncbi:RHS repeat-associated core domain-containing protein [Microbacterium testaceum StLB037]|uniref:RHS repeat-associated core domain-containing protein n=1 Tax=Microbacterium testaceum (strain StLB037) TaxID=979556 RepID=A0A1H0Q3Q2_MICTS|nr:RHS repeat-associated core domain-containing protein [Microbacterium testaceum]SDP12061.1 RHS repeat-associated core domain-containing protein [Microbacterium testaceum StLB037]
MIRRAVAAVVTAAVVFGGGAVAEPPATAAELAAVARAEVLERVRQAASPDEASTANVKKPRSETPAPAGSATLDPGAASTLRADQLGVSAVFSGHDVDRRVTLEARQPADEAMALRTAAAETAGAVVSDVVEITATDAAGERLTSFPAELREVPDDESADGPPVYDVTPGISLTLAVDAARVAEAGVDPATLQIYTRSDPGEPWSLLPSYFDAETGTVRGESDHLSQFVVIGIPFVPVPGPRIVLDPDNDEGSVQTPAPASEFPYNWDLVDRLRGMLEDRCLARVTVTRPAGVRYVSRDTRARVAEAAKPDATVGVGFNTFRGFAWGTEREGGTLAFSRGRGGDNALAQSFVDQMPAYTGRPAKRAASTRNFPFAEYANLPGAYAHVEALYLDHNFDRPVIDHGFGSIVDGAFRSLGGYLETQGFDCSDPATGGWPSPPSQAELARWRNLGYQNHQIYGADPVSFSTGNLVESFPLFALSGPGAQAIEATLVYNAQDGRLSRVGAGWSFSLGARAQRFSDGSVLTVRGDGASDVFTPDGAGGYTSADDPDLTLVEAGAGRLRLADREGASWVFDAADIEGIGELVSHTDPSGDTTTLTYGAADPNVHQFVPLTSVTDAAGQTVTLESDGVGRVTAFRLPDGRTWRLAYDGAGNLASITDATGGTRSFTYDAAHRMLTATDASGSTYLVNVYDDQGRVVSQRDAEGTERRFVYEAGRTVYTDNEGRQSVFGFDDRYRITSVENPAGQVARWEFDARGDVTSHTDEAGRTTRYVYDAAGNLASETDAAGHDTRYTSTPSGQVASRTDALGRTWAYTYDARGLVTGEDRPDGTTTRYEYTPGGDLSAAIAPSGARTRYEYDARGNLTTLIDPLGHRTTYGYDASNRLTAVTDPLGAVTTWEWDAGDRIVATVDPTGARTTFTYDRNDNLTSATDATGAVTRYEWDALLRMVKTIAADGGETRYAYDREDNLVSSTDPEGATTQLLLDAAYRETGVVDPNGGRWEQEVDATGIPTAVTDAAGAVTSLALDELGRTVKTTDPTGVSTSVTYDEVGRVATETDAAGGVTAYAYDALDRVTKVTDPAGFTSEFVYDVDGNLVGTIDRLGNPTLFEVDAAGQVVAMTDATGAVEHYEYDAAGQITAIIDADGGRTTFTYDAAGRTTSVTDPLGAVTRTTYDAVGRVVVETDPLGAEARVEYDSVGRVVRTVDALGAEQRFAYDRAGRRTSATNANGVTTTYAYDAVGNLTTVTEAADAAAPADSDTNVTTTYTYSATGLLTGMTGPTGATTGWEYDAAGRPVVERGPAGERTETAYDAAGRVQRESNGVGLIAAYRYDARGDIVTLTRTDGDATFEYDAEQRRIAMTDPTGVTGWIYDEVGRMREQLDSNGQKLTHEYTATGLTAATTLPDGTVTRFAYDAAGRATTQTTPYGEVHYSYDAVGRRTGIERPNGVSTSVAYDAVGQVTRVSHATPPAADGSAPASATTVPALKTQVDGCRGVGDYLDKRTVPAAGSAKKCVKTAAYLDRRTLPSPETAAPAGASLTYDYAWNADGSVATEARTITAPDGAMDASAQSYDYDDLARLIESATASGETSRYGYDAAGNRTSWATGDRAVTATLDAAGRVTSTSEGASYAYDAAGSRSSAVVDGRWTTFAHDAAGRLTGTSTQDRSIAYGYDGLNRRVASSDTEAFGADESTRAWDGLLPVAGVSSRHGASSLLRDAAGDALVQSGASGVSWLLGDARDVTATASSGGVLDGLVSYGDFGGATFATSGWDAAVGYDGQPGDVSLGLDEYFARSYDPGVGSWLEADSWRGELGDPQSLNRYAYVTNSPVSYADAFGFARTRVGGGSGSRQTAYRSEARNEEIRFRNRVNAHRTTIGQPPVQTLGTSNGRFGGPVPKGTVHQPRSRSGGLQSLRHIQTVRGCGPVDWSCRGSQRDRAAIASSRGGSTGSKAPALNAVLRLFGAVGGAQILPFSVNATDLMQKIPELRQVANLPMSGIGVLVASAHGVRSCAYAPNGLLICQASSNPGGGGTTFGDVFVTTKRIQDVIADKDLLDHEVRHSEQWAGWGAVRFGVYYIGSAGVSQALTGNTGCLNYFELEAGLKEGNYDQICRKK